MPEPETYTITSDDKPENFVFDASKLNLDGPSYSFQTNKPCEAIRFLNGLQDALKKGLAADQDSLKAVHDMERWCHQDGGADRFDAPPAPPAVIDPPSTGPDAPS